jgi:hypothetical protein
MTMRALDREFRKGTSVTRKLEELLGTGPTEARVIRYRSASTTHATITAAASAAPVRRCAAVTVDGDGQVLRAFVSR